MNPLGQFVVSQTRTLMRETLGALDDVARGATPDASRALGNAASSVRHAGWEVHGLATQKLLPDFNRGSTFFVQADRAAQELGEIAKLTAGTAEHGSRLALAREGVATLDTKLAHLFDAV